MMPDRTAPPMTQRELEEAHTVQESLLALQLDGGKDESLNESVTEAQWQAASDAMHRRMQRQSASATTDTFDAPTSPVHGTQRAPVRRVHEEASTRRREPEPMLHQLQSADGLDLGQMSPVDMQMLIRSLLQRQMDQASSG